MTNRKKLYLIVGIGLLIGLIIGAVWWGFHSKNIDLEFLNPSYIKEKISAFGPWSVVIYVSFYIVNTILIFPPNAPISLSAGLLFGPVWGAVMIILSAAIATSLAFFIARLMGRKFVHKYTQGKWDDVSDRLSKKGFLAVFSLRLFPIVPYEVFI